MRRALTIAGSDSGGGAGIQADLKTFAAYGVYGASALTAITAQNTVAVSAVQVLPGALVRAQIDAVLGDIGADAVKTGMLGSIDVVRAVVDALRAHRPPAVVVDPVMIAKSGDSLVVDDVVEAMKAELLRRAFLVTPNIPEAEALSGVIIQSDDDRRKAAKRIAALGARNVVIKGGHLDTPDICDLLYGHGEFMEFRHERIAGRHTHGTGCTFASSIAATLALGGTLQEAIPRAQAYVAGAMAAGIDLGKGHQPMDHFYGWKRQS
jgi:hydroxymethylpyrimidine/phosphomethylpyrimidine kinase